MVDRAGPVDDNPLEAAEEDDDDNTEVTVQEQNGEGGDLGGQDEQMQITDPETSDRYSINTSTKSMVGSVLEYPVENGRRYAGTGPDAYFMPNDEIEQTRLNILHQMYLLLLSSRLTLAPLSSSDPPTRILDIGTGTGEWAINMAELYPSCDVTGTDFSAMQPSAVPSNVFFEIDDAEEEWNFSSPFDLIHVRGMMGAFRDWGKIYAECYRHLKPGGYLEVVDNDHLSAYPPSATSSSAQSSQDHISTYISLLHHASNIAGRPWSTAHLSGSLLASHGFTDITTTTLHVPLGTWHDDPEQKTLGKMWLISVLEGLEGGSLRLFTRELGWTADEVRGLCERVKRDLGAGNMRVATPV
ncbi:MAG: hypothetical protein M1817_006369 [Caeruleum heppii]|nr:MAG: hypothetical protein M1817_006369 [Caeruleum heppii]